MSEAYALPAISYFLSLNQITHMHSFEGKTALVTGASSGIGIEFALQLAARGAVPILVARREARMKQLAEAIYEKCGVEAPVIPADLTAPNAVSELKEAVNARELSVDILINNAGFGFQGEFEGADEQTYITMCTLNVTALTALTRAFLPGMKANGGGILNVSSMAGIAPIPYFSVYAATKAYVCNFGSALWHEMKEAGGNVHVSTLCPGPVETEFFEVAGANPKDVPAREIQQADEVARIGLKALLSNKMMVPTSPSLKLMQKTAALVPSKLGMSAAAAMMKKK